MVGTIIVLTSYSLEPIQNFLYRRKKIGGYARLEWAATESLQLQRAAYQGIGSGTWKGSFDAVPITESDELMGDLPHIYHTGRGSSCACQTKLGAEKLDPAPISPPSTGEASEESNDLAAEHNRHCVSSAEQGSVPILSRHDAEQGTDSSQARMSASRRSTIARMPPLTPALPTIQMNERLKLREAHGDTFSPSELDLERQTLE